MRIGLTRIATVLAAGAATVAIASAPIAMAEPTTHQPATTSDVPTVVAAGWHGWHSGGWRGGWGWR